MCRPLQPARLVHSAQPPWPPVHVSPRWTVLSLLLRSASSPSPPLFPALSEAWIVVAIPVSSGGRRPRLTARMLQGLSSRIRPSLPLVRAVLCQVCPSRWGPPGGSAGPRWSGALARSVNRVRRQCPCAWRMAPPVPLHDFCWADVSRRAPLGPNVSDTRSGVSTKTTAVIGPWRKRGGRNLVLRGIAGAVSFSRPPLSFLPFLLAALFFAVVDDHGCACHGSAFPNAGLLAVMVNSICG